MKRTVVSVIFTVVFLLGCGVKYEVIAPGEISLSPVAFEGNHVIVTGVPQELEGKNFQFPTLFFDGYWYFNINKQLCHERVNWGNLSRILACRKLFRRAIEKGEKVTIAGRVMQGIVELERFQGIKTDASLLKCERPYLGY